MVRTTVVTGLRRHCARSAHGAQSCFAPRKLGSRKEISGQIAQVVTVVSEITAASAGQVNGMTQITRAVAQVNAIAQQVAASAEESVSAAEELNAQASTLNDTVATFELETDGVGRGRPVRRSAPARHG